MGKVSAVARRAVWVIIPIALYISLIKIVGLSPVTKDFYLSDLVSETEKGDSLLQFNLTLYPPSLEDPESLYWPQVEVENIFYYDKTPAGERQPQEICIDQIIIAEVLRGYALDFFDEAIYPLCFPLDEPVKLLSDSENSRFFAFNIPDNHGNWRTSFYGYADHFWYPYDDFQLIFYPQVRYRLFYADDLFTSITTYPVAGFQVPNTAGWQISSYEDELESPLAHQLLESDLETVIVVDFKRPLLEKIIQPSMVAIMLVFIVFLTLVDSVDTFIEGAVAVLFGIFSIRQLLMPPNAQIRTVLDFAIWGLYFAFTGTLLQWLIAILQKKPKEEDFDTPITEPVAIPDATIEEKSVQIDKPRFHRKTTGVVLILISGAILLEWLRERLSHRAGVVIGEASEDCRQ